MSKPEVRSGLYASGILLEQKLVIERLEGRFRERRFRGQYRYELCTY